MGAAENSESSFMRIGERIQLHLRWNYSTFHGPARAGSGKRYRTRTGTLLHDGETFVLLSEPHLFDIGSGWKTWQFIALRESSGEISEYDIVKDDLVIVP
jgi:hypothetical protein